MACRDPVASATCAARGSRPGSSIRRPSQPPGHTAQWRRACKLCSSAKEDAIAVDGPGQRRRASGSAGLPPQRGLSQKRLASTSSTAPPSAQLPLPPDKGRCEAHTGNRLGTLQGGDLHRRRHLCRQPELARRCCGTGGVPQLIPSSNSGWLQAVAAPKLSVAIGHEVVCRRGRSRERGRAESGRLFSSSLRAGGGDQSQALR